MRPLKVLSVDFDVIEQSMRDVSRENSEYFFNRITGRVVVLSKSLIKALALEDGSSREGENIPAWEKSLIPVARQIVVKGSPDYIRIPEAFGRPEHAWMKEFADDVRSLKLRQKLLQALNGRGCRNRFKEILREHPEELRRWTMVRSKCWKEKIQQWLEGMGILAVERNPKKPRATLR